MSRRSSLFLGIAALSLAVAACGKKTEAPTVTASTTATATATMTVAATATATEAALPDVSVAEDFEERATLEVKEKDLAGQVDALEKEIATDKP